MFRTFAGALIIAQILTFSVFAQSLEHPATLTPEGGAPLPRAAVATRVDWRAELIPKLESAATAHLRGTFAPIRRGDVVLIEYIPQKGTSVRVNKAVAVSGVNHDLMLAFLDHWVGQRPVSDEIKHTLIGS